MLGYEGANLVEEHVETGMSFQRNMVAAWQLDELGTWNQASRQTALADRNLIVTRDVEYQRRDMNLPGDVAVVHQAVHFGDPRDILGRATYALKFVETVLDFLRGVGQEAGSRDRSDPAACICQREAYDDG